MMLTDCSACGNKVAMNIDIDGVIEDCTRCGVAQGIIHQVLPPEVVAQIRKAWRSSHNVRDLSRRAGRLEANVDRVAALHEAAYDSAAGDPDRPPWCAECGHPHPCRTVQQITKDAG